MGKNLLIFVKPIGFLLVLFFFITAQATPLATLSTRCIACHQQDGNSTNPLWPKLAGQVPRYTYTQLKAFQQGKAGGRENPSMTPFLMDLDDKALEALAEYFSKKQISPGFAKKEDVSLGQGLYRGGNLKTQVPACIACHGPRGEGNKPAGFPRVGGQHALYSLKQLKDYREGKRTSPSSAVMPTIAKRMSDKEMEAVAHYMEGLY